MSEEGFCEKIMTESVALFAEKGFHGTSMRDISSAVGCSLPVLYYYYKNKQDLYREIVLDEFFRMHESLNKSLSFTGDLTEFYKTFLKSRKHLTPYQKALYRLSYKASCGFEEDETINATLRNWENEREQANRKLIAKYFGSTSRSDILATIFFRMIESINTKLVIQDTDIPDEQIDREVDLLFLLISHAAGPR